MFRVSRKVRLAAVVAIVLSSLAVVGVSPSGADPSASGSAVNNGYTGTATITYANTSDFQVYIIDGATEGGCDDSGDQPDTGILATIGVDSPAPASPFTVDTSTLVGPAPAHALGTGSFFFCLYDETEGWTLLEPASTIAIFDPVSSSIADNGNGSVILTYANADNDFSQLFYFYLFANQTSCPEIMDPSLPGFGFQPGYGLPDSPAVIGVGTLGVPLPLDESSFEIPALTPVTAGSYAACSYMTSSETGDLGLAQQLLVSIYTPVEPVVPAFTG